MQKQSRNNRALVLIQTQFNSQIEPLARAFKFLKDNYELTVVSSIYKRLESYKGDKTNQGPLSVAVVVETGESPEALQERFDSYMTQNPHSVDILVALYENETRLTPQLTLPHPDLHTVPPWLVPAAEIWGDAPHPILGRPLNVLANDIELKGWGEFYAQGKTLLDFYYNPQK